jgi:hypothetical protein
MGELSPALRRRMNKFLYQDLRFVFSEAGGFAFAHFVVADLKLGKAASAAALFWCFSLSLLLCRGVLIAAELI